MIRKAIIVVLTLAAVGMANITTISIWMPLGWIHDLNDLTTACYVIKGGVLTATYRPNSKQVIITTWRQRQVPSSLILLPRSVTRLGAKSTPRGSFLSLPALRHRTFSPFPSKAYKWTELHLPLWLPFILFGTCLTIAFMHGPLRRRHRRKRGECIKCGYNLTGNVSGICPECGTRIEQP